MNTPENSLQAQRKEHFRHILAHYRTVYIFKNISERTHFFQEKSGIQIKHIFQKTIKDIFKETTEQNPFLE